MKKTELTPNTPYFLINREKLDNLTDDMLASLQAYWENGIVAYSFKTNNLPWLVDYMKNKGLYAEVVSSDEFNLALKCNFPFQHIVFNGPVKGKAEFETALKNPCIVNLDSKRELRWLSQCSDIKASLGLRVNFDLEKDCPGQSQCGLDDGRFGFSYETGEFRQALDFMKELGLPLDGIHLHCSSKTRSKDIYDSIAATALKLVQEYDLELKYIDIGGGFFGGLPGKPSFRDYFSSVKSILGADSRLKDINIIVEPGMALVGSAIDYVTSVTDTKATPHNYFAVTDGSRIHIDPFMKKSSYSYTIERLSENPSSEKLKKQTLCGFTCIENDRFFALEDQAPLQEGDRIIFQKVGAYTMGLSPLFIQFFPAVYLKTQDELRLVRSKWTADNFMQG